MNRGTSFITNTFKENYKSITDILIFNTTHREKLCVLFIKLQELIKYILATE
jgi:hypothetical protein